MDETVLSRPPKPLRNKTLTMFIRVRAEDLIAKFHGVEGRAKFTLDNIEMEDVPDGMEYFYIQRVTVRNGALKRSYTYLYVKSKPADVVANEVPQIVAELDAWGLAYDATLAVAEMVGQRTYEDGTLAARILAHLPERGMTSALNAILENPSRFLLISKVYKNNITPRDRKLVIKTSNHHCFLMGDEDDLVRLKLKHGGMLLDMQELREKGRDTDYTG